MLRSRVVDECFVQGIGLASLANADVPVLLGC